MQQLEISQNKILLGSDIQQLKAAKSRQILGETAKDIPDEQLEMFVAQFEYLISCWLDSFEKQLFEGKTLKEITNSNSV